MSRPNFVKQNYLILQRVFAQSRPAEGTPEFAQWLLTLEILEKEFAADNPRFYLQTWRRGIQRHYDELHGTAQGSQPPPSTSPADGVASGEAKEG